MTAYIIVEAEVHDPEKFSAYAKTVPAIVAEFGGEYLVLGGQQESLEGDWGPSRRRSRLRPFGTATPTKRPNRCGKEPAVFG